uniref:Uncharacterized protein n=1 Tax=Rhizophora mucronata TaxID=61149 RepID=A0A2P2IWR3_RHIMU
MVKATELNINYCKCDLHDEMKSPVPVHVLKLYKIWEITQNSSLEDIQKKHLIQCKPF